MADADYRSFIAALQNSGKTFKEICAALEEKFGPEASNFYVSVIGYAPMRPHRRHVYRLHGDSRASIPFIVILDEAKGDIEADLPDIKAAVKRGANSDHAVVTFRAIEYLGYEGG